MGDKTGIQWTDATWNPIVGCSIVSPACTNCYAMAQAARIQRMAAGAGKETHYDLTTKEVNGKPVWTGVLKQAPEHILTLPLRWKKPRRIFVNSMSDPFHESVPDEWIDEVFAIGFLSHWHILQILTKRSARMRAYCNDPKTPNRIFAQAVRIAGLISKNDAGAAEIVCSATSAQCGQIGHGAWPFKNFWLGVTAEDQPRADERIPDLLATPAAVRFVSVEPMLRAVDLETIVLRRNGERPNELSRKLGDYVLPLRGAFSDSPHIDWVICGGESGPDARPMHPDWARGLRDQFTTAGVPFFFKQWGEWKPVCEMGEDEINDAYYPAPENFPEARRRPRFAQCVLHDDAERFDDIAARGAFSAGKNGMLMIRTGKSNAGRLLDGREHNAFPEARP